MDKIKVKSNIVARQLRRSTSRISVFQGGARSGKTFNILIWIIFTAVKSTKPIYVTICRATMPALKASSFRDFIEIMTRMGYYDPKNLNKTDLIYTFQFAVFEFISIDQPDRVRGRKRDILFINEANEIDYDSWMQLIMRTTGKVIIDYNPSMEHHWIYDDVISREDTDFYQSTYKDNPFLEKSIIAEIKRLEFVDENYWKIYGLGERGHIEGLVFKNWTQTREMPEGDRFYGLDFGYTNHPTALIEVMNINDNIYVKELIYERGMTNRDIAERMQEMGVTDLVVADSAEPKSIDELTAEGLYVIGAEKGPDSIRKGIDLLKQYSIHIEEGSVNLIKEFRNYKWEKDKEMKKGYKNKPVDAFNHGIDALRYACMDKLRSYELMMF